MSELQSFLNVALQLMVLAGAQQALGEEKGMRLGWQEGSPWSCWFSAEIQPRESSLLGCWDTRGIGAV